MSIEILRNINNKNDQSNNDATNYYICYNMYFPHI